MSITSQNIKHWQNEYTPGRTPSSVVFPKGKYLKNIKGPILDLGTGDGNMAEALSKQNHEVYAIDINPKAIDANKKRGSSIYYSTQNILEGTNFKDNFFDLIIINFVLTSIHRDSWGRFNREVYRILKTGSVVWITEPLVSESYKSRYALAKEVVNCDNCVYVFHEQHLAEVIKSKKQLEKAIADNKVSRIVKHYKEEELVKEVFQGFELSDSVVKTIKSPSGFDLNVYDAYFKKAQPVLV